MHIIIGLGLALVLLWGWLIGHWFARVVMFLVMGFCLGLVGCQFRDAPILGLLVGIALGWPVSGIPIYIRRYMARPPSTTEPHWAANPAPIKLTLR